jgi:hypothetical protein
MIDHRRGVIQFFAWTIVAVCVAQVFAMLFVVPGFVGIYHDMLPGRSLPPLTAAVIRGRWVLVGQACLSPVAAFFLARRTRTAPPFGVIITLGVLLGVTIFELPLITLALFRPLI